MTAVTRFCSADDFSTVLAMLGGDEGSAATICNTLNIQTLGPIAGVLTWTVAQVRCWNQLGQHQCSKLQ